MYVSVHNLWCACLQDDEVAEAEDTEGPGCLESLDVDNLYTDNHDVQVVPGPGPGEDDDHADGIEELDSSANVRTAAGFC